MHAHTKLVLVLTGSPYQKIDSISLPKIYTSITMYRRDKLIMILQAHLCFDHLDGNLNPFMQELEIIQLADITSS